MFLPVVLCCLYWSQHAFLCWSILSLCSIHESCCYHYTTLITQSPTELFFFMLLCGDIPCSPTLKKHISSSSIFSFWILEKSAERPTCSCGFLHTSRRYDHLVLTDSKHTYDLHWKLLRSSFCGYKLHDDEWWRMEIHMQSPYYIFPVQNLWSRVGKQVPTLRRYS